MLLYALKLLLYVTPVAIGVSIICFLLLHIAPGALPAHPWMTIAGVVGDVRHRALGDPAGPEMFLPFSLADWAPTMVYVIRAAGDDPAALAASLRAAVCRHGARCSRFP